MFWRSALLAVIALSLVMADDAWAQRGRGGGGRDRGGDRGSRDRGGDRGSRDRGGDRGSRGRGSDSARMLQSLDRNGNGQLDPNEMQGNAGRFIEPMLRSAGINTGRPISIQELQRLSGGGGGRDNDRGRDRGRNEAPLVLGFGNESEGTIVPGFGPLAASVEVALNEEFDERTIRRVDFFMDRADTNHNGTLDREEWEGLGGRYNTTEADKNRDGRISRMELASQMQAESERDDDDRRDRGRGDDDDNRRGGDPRVMFGGGYGGFGGRGGGDDDEGRGRGRGGRGGRGRGGDFGNFDGGGGRDWGGGGGGEWTRDEDGNPVFVPNEDGEDRGRGRGRGRGDDEEEEFQSAKLDGRTSYSLSSTEIERGTPSAYSQMDGNGDGILSMNEFLTGGDSSLSPNAKAASFERMDGNGDGILTSNEFNVGTDPGQGGRPFGRRERDSGNDNDDDNSSSSSRDESPRSSPATSSNASPSNTSLSSSSSSSSGDRETKYAISVVTANDKNGDNILSADEWPNTKLIDLNAADADKNGQLTVEEITAQIKKK